MDDLAAWVGRTQTTRDTITPAMADRMAATLDAEATFQTGDALPSLWHWMAHPHVVPTSRIGPDGHPSRGGFMPPIALPRRMWAGSRVTFDAPLPVGHELTRTSAIARVAPKEGRSGRLCFVTVRHTIEAGGAVAVTDEHDIVYRDDPDPEAAPPPPVAPPDGAVTSQTIVPDPVLLFRYSALTFNGHRIHYDRDYCRQVEGYPGLVVHGPLIATLLGGLAERVGGARLARFAFRAVSPLFDTAPFAIHADGAGTVWATRPDGALAMKAEVAYQ